MSVGNNPFDADMAIGSDHLNEFTGDRSRQIFKEVVEFESPGSFKLFNGTDRNSLNCFHRLLA